jgi:hypothetical protein
MPGTDQTHDHAAGVTIQILPFSGGTYAGWPNVTVQVLPFSAGAHAGMDGTFTMLLYDESAGRNFVFAQTMPDRRMSDDWHPNQQAEGR